MRHSHPLTLSQLSFYYEYFFVPPEKKWQANLFDIWKIPSGKSLKEVSNALRELIDKHDTFRTVFDFSDPTNPAQILERNTGGVFRVLDSSTNNISDDIFFTVSRFAREPFNIEAQQPWRICVIKSDGSPSHVVVAMHHIAVDAFSWNLLFQDFLDIIEGKKSSIYKSPVELAEEQHSQSWENRLGKSRRYIERALSANHQKDISPVIGESRHTVLTSLKSHRAARAIREISNSENTSESSIISAFYSRCISNFFAQENILLRSASSNRFSDEARSVIGIMNQWVPIPLEPQGENCTSFLRTINARSIRAYQNGIFDPMHFRGKSGNPSLLYSNLGYFFNYLNSGAPKLGNEIEDWIDPLVESYIPTNTSGAPFYLVAGSGDYLNLILRSKLESFSSSDAHYFLKSMERDIIEYT
ncbi:condensation domain-containing protein [Nocardiopsis coralli]|uniref:condensation domain-containing protein n=1 Tax=Nocardiopsis coralli TaxID=2772213 RepID=UPI0018665467|nr:condensation domain-containing protein [Nocardiopsis coralli]